MDLHLILLQPVFSSYLGQVHCLSLRFSSVVFFFLNDDKTYCHRGGVNEVIYVKYSVQCLPQDMLDKWLLQLLLLTETGNNIIKNI